MPIQTAVATAHQNYEAAMNPDKLPMKKYSRYMEVSNLIPFVDNHGFAPDFRYGQSIFVIEGFAVTELKIYKFDNERVYAVRWNGVRTSVPRDKVIFITEQGANDALNRMRGMRHE